MDSMIPQLHAIYTELIKTNYSINVILEGG